VAARVGGEEFMLIVPDDAQRKAEALAETIRVEVRNLRLAELAEGPELSISAGVARAGKATSASVHALYAAADDALYTAKHAGRDCVRTFPGWV
jgi:diguanylate cyclase (GGDEF)-like protein